MGPAGFRRRGRRRGLVVGAAVGAAAARRGSNNQSQDSDGGVDQYAELERLGQLKSEGLLTEDEFESKKKQILGL
jgi:hypothetical protein